MPDLAAPVPYVALGDSYAAGLGAGPRTDPCWRALGGYPVLVAQRLGVGLAYEACIGGTIADVLANQLGSLGPQTRYVSLTIGGNDADFVPVVIEAAKPEWAADLDAVLGRALEKLRTRVPGELDRLLARVHELAPTAKVVLTGYPHLFNGQDCQLATFFSASDMDRLDAAADELIATIHSAASAHDVGFVDVRDTFRGHAICDVPEWVNGVSVPIEASFHPNPDGHRAYATLVATAFGAAPEDLVPSPTELPATQISVIPGAAVPGSAPTFADWPFGMPEQHAAAERA